jgi:hypothetical protein
MGMSMISKFYYENDTGYLSPIHLEQNNTYLSIISICFFWNKFYLELFQKLSDQIVAICESSCGNVQAWKVLNRYCL